MASLIFSTATRYMLPLLLLFSVFALIRGHNHPGGGFVGGLVAAAAFSLYAFAYNVEKARQALRINPRILIGSGLLIALGSGITSLSQGLPFMTGLWSSRQVPLFGKLGTPVVFDIGVYLVVIGVVVTIVFTLAEQDV